MPRQGETHIDTYKLLDAIETLVDESKTMFGLTMISKDEFFDLANKLRASLPDEMRRANRVNQESERIVGGAKETAHQTVVDAQTESERLMESAHAQADKMVKDAESRAQNRLAEADSVAHKAVTEARSQAAQTVQDAKQASDKIILEATRKAEHLVSDSDVMRLAAAQAKEIVGAAETDGREMRRGAEEYAREELSKVERVLTDTLLIVQRGRNKLDQRLTSHDTGSSAPPRTGGTSAGEMAASRR